MAAEGTKTALLTAEDFFDWLQRPENEGRHFELVRGEVKEVPRPGGRHCHICANVVWLLGNYMGQRRKGRVLSNDAGLILARDPDTVRGPDVVYFDDVKPYDQLNPKFAEGLPVLAVEVLSPNDRIGKVTRRIKEFLTAGVKLVWLIDPEARDITVYRQGEEPQVFDLTQELTDDLLPDFRCPVADLFVVSGE